MVSLSGEPSMQSRHPEIQNAVIPLRGLGWPVRVPVVAADEPEVAPWPVTDPSLTRLHSCRTVRREQLEFVVRRGSLE